MSVNRPEILLQVILSIFDEILSKPVAVVSDSELMDDLTSSVNIVVIKKPLMSSCH